MDLLDICVYGGGVAAFIVTQHMWSKLANFSTSDTMLNLKDGMQKYVKRANKDTKTELKEREYST